MSATKECIYCGHIKPIKDFSFEHIWPDAIGGDYLDSFWHTSEVCRSCNSMAGVFVDGAFIKSFAISIERANDAQLYLSPDNLKASVPLNFLGNVQNVATADGEALDFWVCTGANIIHLRSSGEELWDTYAGGDPRSASKKSRTGRVIVSFTSSEPYWICIALASVKKHFPKAALFVSNLELPETAKNFSELDPENPAHFEDLSVLKEFEALGENGERVHGQFVVSLDAESRFMSKLALGIGCNLFGQSFAQSSCGLELRKSFREANHKKRQDLLVKGSGLFKENRLGKLEDKLRWPGGWQLTLLRPGSQFALLVTAPSGKNLTIQITDETKFLSSLDGSYADGKTWVVVPTAQTAIGPISYPDYIAYQIGMLEVEELRALENLRKDPSKLPPTGIKFE